MINLSELSLSDLMPESIKHDKNLSALANVLDNELKQITACIDQVALLPQIDQLPENIIDSLAWQFHVDFYEPLGLDLDKKRALVKNSLRWHRRKGTKSVIEEMVSILYGEKCKIQEWFEYGGSPYFFKVKIDNVNITQESYNYILRAVYELKNVRSWLEGITVNHDVPLCTYVGHTVHQTKRKIIGWSRSQRIPNQPLYVVLTAMTTKHQDIGFTIN